MPEISDALIYGYAQADIKELTVPEGETRNDKEFLDAYKKGFEAGYEVGYDKFSYEFEIPAVENPTWSFHQGFALGVDKGQWLCHWNEQFSVMV